MLQNTCNLENQFWKPILNYLDTVDRFGRAMKIEIISSMEVEQHYLKIIKTTPFIIQRNEDLICSFPSEGGTIIFNLDYEFCNKLLGSNLSRYLNGGGKLPALFAELFEIPKPEDNIVIDINFLLQRWEGKLYFRQSLPSGFNKIKQKLVSVFLNTLEYKTICRKVKITGSNSSIQKNERRFFYWFAIWFQKSYPSLAKFSLYKQVHNDLRLLENFDYPKIIQYLPAFVLWNIKKYVTLTPQNEWTIHLIKGNNIRTAKALPIPITKSMRHPFAHAPITSNYFKAFDYAKIISLGGNLKLYKLFNSQLKVGSIHDSLWTNFLQLVLKEEVICSGIEKEILCAAIGYLKHLTDEGIAINLQGRTYSSLCLEVDEWYQKQSYVKRLHEEDIIWQNSNIKAFYYHDMKGTEYKTIELLSYHQLVYEGMYMNHCVSNADYVSGCVSGDISIWSFQKITSETIFRIATIEVSANKKILQIRGKYNSAPSEDILNHIAQWSEQVGLSHSY